MTTLKEAEKLLETISPKIRRNQSKKGITEKWLGKFKGIIPDGKSSTEYIRELRATLYGKIK